MMKQQSILLMLLLFFPLFAFPNHVRWQGIYDKSLQQAYDEEKPLLVLVVKEKNLLCNEIIVKTFMNQPYIDKINKKFVTVIVTYEGDQSYPIELYYTTFFPTLFMVDSQKETFLSTPLYEHNITVKQLEKMLNKF